MREGNLVETRGTLSFVYLASRALRREPFGARSARSLGTLERMGAAGTERPLPTNREWLKFRVLSEMLCLSSLWVLAV